MMTITPPEPCSRNDYLVEHISILRRCYCHWTGHDLMQSGCGDGVAAKKLYYAPFVVVSHDTSNNPVFNYANRIALQLFEMSWSAFTILPSRHSAEPVEREQRARFLAKVSSKGFSDDYQGVRISASGKRFLVQNAIVWNLFRDDGSAYGQAARFDKWTFL